MLAVDYCFSIFTRNKHEKAAGSADDVNVFGHRAGGLRPIAVRVLIWFFGGVSYWALDKALDAAWDDFEDWLDEWGDDPDPKYDDYRLEAVCEFYYEYNFHPDTTDEQQRLIDELGQALEKDNRYCDTFP